MHPSLVQYVVSRPPPYRPMETATRQYFERRKLPQRARPFDRDSREYALKLQSSLPICHVQVFLDPIPLLITEQARLTYIYSTQQRPTSTTEVSLRHEYWSAYFGDKQHSRASHWSRASV